MNLNIDTEFRDICREIVASMYTIEEWTAIESCDMFQTKKYCGGFDADEGELCFSVYIDNLEYWFQINLPLVTEIAAGAHVNVRLRKA